jgi:hypothetical protein
MNRENFTRFLKVLPCKLEQALTPLTSIPKLLGSDPGRNTDNPE